MLTQALWTVFLDRQKRPCLRLKWRWRRMKERKVLWKSFKTKCLI